MSAPQRKYPWGPLWELAAGRGLTMGALVLPTRINVSNAHRWRKAGELPEWAADTLALSLGVMPADVWAEWEADGERSADEADAARRASHAAAKKRWRAKRAAEKRAGELAYLADYRAQYRDALNAQRRAYYQRNREREIRAAVERKRRLRRGQEAS